MSFFCINCRSKTDPGFKACPYCGDPITDFLRKYTEEPIDGKYRILSRLGIGGMGEVYKVLHLHLNAPRVVKMMRPALSEDERAHERFIREAQLATRIQHPNVAALFDFSTLEDGSYYMVWEYIDGITFADLLRARGFLSPRYAASLSLQVLDGLKAIHRQGVVHRDVSPENMMITFDDEENERIKIIDLGIAKQWTNETDDQTKTGMFVGKWKYCSPEHLGMLKPDEKIDGRADIYSYGIVLYELLTGRVPFIADSPHRFLLLHSTESPPPLSEANPELGNISELESILFRALEKDREKRFRSASQFAAALEAVLSSLPEAPGLPPGAASPDIATGEKAIGTLEAEPKENIGKDEVTLDVSTPDPVPADTIESDAVAIALQDAPFIAADHEPEEEVEPRPAPEHSGDQTMVQDTEEELFSTAEVTERVGLDQRTLHQAPIEGASSRRAGSPWPWVGLILVLVAAVAGFFLLRGERADVSSEEPVISEVPVPPVIPSMVGIQAWPWGTVDELRNEDSGEIVQIDDPVTPLSLDLAPGSYHVVISNPSYDRRIERRFSVSSEVPAVVSVQFEAPESLPLPQIGDGR